MRDRDRSLRRSVARRGRQLTRGTAPGCMPTPADPLLGSAWGSAPLSDSCTRASLWLARQVRWCFRISSPSRPCSTLGRGTARGRPPTTRPDHGARLGAHGHLGRAGEQAALHVSATSADPGSRRPHLQDGRYRPERIARTSTRRRHPFRWTRSGRGSSSLPGCAWAIRSHSYSTFTTPQPYRSPP